jgi:hypothetical protein
MIWVGVLFAAVAGLFAVNALYLRWYLQWEHRNTSGMAYYGRPLLERRVLKRRIRWLSLPVLPYVRLLALGNQGKATMPVFEYQGVCGPPGVSSPEVFERAMKYQPRAEDVFVVTQMRCGTTWMQQVVYEVVHRGRGNLTDTGHNHLYAVSPWIDGSNGVTLDDAPLVGERPTRIIKTHLPIKLCPYSEQAKYIYVARHPVSCFASIADYNRTLLGPLIPDINTIVEWFCSDRMYWLPWPEHVSGWWQWAMSRSNVLFVHYEEMATDFAGVLDRLAVFLGYELTADEKQRITEKCSFRYMKVNEELFEMSPPNMFSVIGGRFFTSGEVSRHEDVTATIRQSILEYCRQTLGQTQYPAHNFYPDLTPRTLREHQSVRPSVLEPSPRSQHSTHAE